jgi:hypothetical protein
MSEILTPFRPNLVGLKRISSREDISRYPPLPCPFFGVPGSESGTCNRVSLDEATCGSFSCKIILLWLFCCGYFVVVLYSGHIYIFLSIFILVMLLCVELKFYFT